MEFIGQNTIITELKYLLADIERGNNFNILLRAPSGFGKTTLGLICLNRLGYLIHIIMFLMKKEILIWKL